MHSINYNVVNRKSEILKLVNGRILDIKSGCYYENGTSIYIKQGRILAVDNGSRAIDMTPDYIFDLKGKTVIPGLFNTHCHIQTQTFVMLKEQERQTQIHKMLDDCLQFGITNIRDTMTESLRLNALINENISSGKLSGPRIHQCVHVAPIGGTYAPKQTLSSMLLMSATQRPVVKYNNPDSGIVVFPKNANVSVIRDAVDSAIDERGAQYIKFCDQNEIGFSYKPGASVMDQTQLDAAADQARKRGVVSTIHHVTVESFRKAINAGVTSIAHIAGDAELSDKDIGIFLESGIYLEPTMTVPYYYCWNMPGKKGYNHPELIRLTQYRERNFISNIEKFWIPSAHNSLKGQKQMVEQNKLKLFVIMDISIIYEYFLGLITYGTKNIRKLYKAGAFKQFACGNDACVTPSSLAAVGFELEMLDYCLNDESGNDGLSGLDALRIATINSARAMGLEKDFGSIEAGKVADLAIVEGDPLNDYRVVGSKVAALFMDGELKINNCGICMIPVHVHT